MIVHSQSCNSLNEKMEIFGDNKSISSKYFLKYKWLKNDEEEVDNEEEKVDCIAIGRRKRDEIKSPYQDTCKTSGAIWR